MKKHIQFAITFFTLSALFIGLGYYILKKERAALFATIEPNFDIALNLELEGRIKETGLPFHLSMQPSRLPNDDFVVYQTKDTTIYIEKDSSYRDRDLLQRQRAALQVYLLEEGCPIHVQTLDSIYASKLWQKGSHITTGVRYINNLTGVVTDSKPGNRIYTTFSTLPHTFGSSDEIVVQGFYNLTFYWTFLKTPLPFILLFIFWLISIALLSFLIFKKKKKQEISYVHVSEIKKTIETSPMIKINDSIYYDAARLEIHYNDQVIPLSKQLATLFSAFLGATDYYLPYANIDQILGAQNVRTKALHRLRDALKPLPALQIEHINSTGYQLQVTKE